MAGVGDGASGRGLFLTLEGADGCGKSTKGAWLVRDLAAAGVACTLLRDPGSTEVSERIRRLLLDPASTMADGCELLLYEAARAQLVEEAIRPALARGEVVVCDRFCDSTLAYQAWGRGLPEDEVRAANALGSRGLVPDRTVVFDLPVASSFERATRHGVDRMELAGLPFQERVRAGYLAIAAAEPGRVRVVDASGSKERSYALMLRALADVLPVRLGADAGEGAPDGRA